MRYTTIIDLSEYPSLYRNTNVRLVFLHLTLRSGYRPEDRDIYFGSLRQLASEVGITLSALRHALKLLQAANMVKPYKGGLAVRKYVRSEQITPRPKTKREEDMRRLADQREKEQAKLFSELEEQRRLAHTPEAEAARLAFARKYGGNKNKKDAEV